MTDLMINGLNLARDTQNRLHFWGEVLNLGDKTRRWVRVTIRLLDSEGDLLADESDILGLEWTPPHAKNPFHIRFQRPPEGWSTYDIHLEGHIHDFDDPKDPQPYYGLTVDKLHFRDIERADLHCAIVGLLSNKGILPSSHVKVAGTLYDATGKVVGVLSPYLVARGIFSPGETLSFELKYYALGGTVADFNVQVQGRQQIA